MENKKFNFDITLNIMNLIYVILVLILLSSCKEETRQQKEIRELIGRQIDFVDGYEFMPNSCDITLSRVVNSRAKVVSYIEDSSCTECMFNMLKSWSNEVKDIDQNTEYLFVINSENREEISQGLSDFDINRPVFHYTTDTFKQANKLDVLARNRTFLLNKENKIVAVGEPFGNEKVKEFYRNVIKDNIAISSENQSNMLILNKDNIKIDSIVQINKQQSETFSSNAIRPYSQIIVSPGFFPTENYCKLDNQLVFLVEEEDLYRIDAYKKTMSYNDWLRAYELSLPEVKKMFEKKIKTPVLVYVSLKD